MRIDSSRHLGILKVLSIRPRKLATLRDIYKCSITRETCAVIKIKRKRGGGKKKERECDWTYQNIEFHVLFYSSWNPRFFFFFKKSTQKSVFFLVLVATCITKEGQPGYKTMQHCGNARYITHRNYTIYSKYKHRTNKLHLNFYLRWLFSSKLRTIWNEENSWNINGTRDTGFRFKDNISLFYETTFVPVYIESMIREISAPRVIPPRDNSVISHL